MTKAIKPAKPVAKQRAVICDDDAMTRTMMRAMLERCGYEVIAGVGTALEALQVVVTYQADLLMLDLVLPAMPGEDIIEPVRTGAPNCTIVISSSFDPSVAIRHGALYVVAKGETKKLEETLTALAGRGTGVAV